MWTKFLIATIWRSSLAECWEPTNKPSQSRMLQFPVRNIGSKILNFSSTLHIAEGLTNVPFLVNISKQTWMKTRTNNFYNSNLNLLTWPTNFDIPNCLTYPMAVA